MNYRSKAAASMVAPKVKQDEEDDEPKGSTSESLGGLLVGLSGNEDIANLSSAVQSVVKMSKKKQKPE